MDYINHYIFLRAIAENLSQEIEDLKINICYSFSDKEMIIHLESGEALIFNSVYNKSILYLQKRAPAKKNVAPKFRYLSDLKIKKVLISPLDRNIIIKLESQYSLIFKMHGRNANVLVMKESECIDMLNDNFKADQLRAEEEYLAEGKLEFIWNEEIQALFENSKFEDQKSFLLENSFNFKLIENEIQLANNKEKSPLDLAAAYARYYLSENALSSRQRTIENWLNNELKRAQKSLKSHQKNLQKIESSDYQKQGDLIMANLHRIETGSKQVVLSDFEGESEVRITLKEKLSPQENAENFYNKAKNQKLEKEKAEQLLREAMQRLESIESLTTTYNKIKNDWKMLNAFEKQHFNQAGEAQTEAEPYRSFTFKGFEILVGKKAKDNDVLTLKIADKNDIWLHAKDVAGSHTVIKRAGAKHIPKEVIEYAAGLALYYSKHKNQSLAPVSYTDRKYVYKPKGAAPGSMNLRKEEVLITEPINPSSDRNH